MKKILITGSNGQLANRFIKNYQSKFNILALNRNQLDITNNRQVNKIKMEFDPDIILNCAAFTNVDEAEKNFTLANQINSDAIKNLLENFNGLFIYISTDYVFNGENGPYKIYDTVSPINKYGLSKLNGEILTARNSDNYIIIRANVIFDINSRASFLSWVLNSIKSQNEISVVNDQIGNPLSTVDLADFIFQSISNNYNGTFHVGSKDYKSRFEFAQLIAEIWRVDKNLILPISTLELKNKVESYIAPRPLKSGLFVSQEFKAISLEESILKIKTI